MRRFLFFLLIVLIPVMVAAQSDSKYNGYAETADIWNGDEFGYDVSDAAKVYLNGSYIYIIDAESLYVFIPLNRSRGSVWIHGTITASDTLTYSGKDSVYFDIAAHTGDGNDLKASEEESYTAMDSAHVAATNGTASFSFWPMKNSTVKEEACVYWTLRVRNLAGNLSKVYVKIEWVDAYKR